MWATDMIKRAAVIALAVVIAACSVSTSDAKRHKKPATPTVDSPNWYFNYGAPNPVMEAGGLSFVWTASPYVEPHYWLRNDMGMFAGDLATVKAKSISVTYRIDVLSGTPDFQSTECGTKSPVNTGRATLMIRNSLNNSERFNRAWTVVSLRKNLEPGLTTITVPLDGSMWKFVYSETGLTNPNEWNALLSKAIDIGLTFNGCSSAGHGAYVVGGSARMTIVSVSVQ